MQDARFQQLYEQYQDAVLRAAREVDDAAVGFAKTGEQIALLAEAVKAARRSLDIATIQYREGLTDFQRVLDSQRTLFSQQERLVISRGDVDAEPDCPLQGAWGAAGSKGEAGPCWMKRRVKPWSKRSDWERPAARPRCRRLARMLHQTFPERRTMSEEPSETPSDTPAPIVDDAGRRSPRRRRHRCQAGQGIAGSARSSC